ncbi:hypothetical protein GTA08_BOTSDO03493 [Neofusicoccum parvum]|nr:hypothetical protein GTA08_BOTSDO03493 [Neofusicoccum parvum]
MASIHDLPAELLGEIAGHLDNERRRDHCPAWDGDRDRSNPRNPVLKFCLVSKLFLRVAEPLLYSFFSNGIERDWRAHPHRRAFLHRIIQRPDLAARVSEIRIGVLDEEFGKVTRPKRSMYGMYNIGGYEDSDDDSDLDPYHANNVLHHQPEDDGADDASDGGDEAAIQNLNSRSDRLAFTSAAHHIDMHNKSAWLEELRSGSPNAELVLLLCLTPNLTKLVLGLPDKSGYDYNYRSFRSLLSQVRQDVASARTTGPLRALRTLYIEFDAEKVESVFALGFPAHYMRDFFYLPSLQELKGYKITTKVRYTEGIESDDDMDDDDMDDGQDDPSTSSDSTDISDSDGALDPPNTPSHPTWPKRTSPIKSLTLNSANITNDSLSQLLSACTALSTLSCAWSDDFDTPNPMDTERSHIFWPPHILRALAPHASTLTSLTLHADHPFHDEPGIMGMAEDLARLGSLKSLAALRHLAVSALLLTGSLRRDLVAARSRRTGRCGRVWRTRKPAEGYAALADVFPDALEALVVRCRAEGAPVLRFLEPLVVEVARRAGAGKMPGLRRWELEGGWGKRLPPERVAEVCTLLGGSGVDLVLDGETYGSEGQQMLMLMRPTLQKGGKGCRRSS